MSTMETNVKAGERHALGRKALRGVIPVLRQLILDTAELQTHVERARSSVPEEQRRIRSLLEGLTSELTVCSSLLSGRFSTPPSTLHLLPGRKTNLNLFWRLYPREELDCREHLEVLLAGYSHYVRNVYDSIRTLECVGDAESVEIANRLIAAAEKGLCFIELYLEGLALQMDGDRLPAWPVSADLLK
jgi:hypothetical protein